MGERVTVGQTLDGRVVARKTVRGEPGEQRLRHEAEMLERARHPGVVELVGLDEGDDELVLVTIVAGDRPLSLARRPPLPQAAGLTASIAATLCDLHGLGVVHGRLDASHVVLGPGGRPVLCGFAEAGLVTDLDGPQPADDVDALGRLLKHLVEPDTELEPIPERRLPWRRSAGPRWTGYQRRALMTLADQATAPDPRHRPSARALAAALVAAFPEATVAPIDAGPEPVEPRGESGPTGLAADPPAVDADPHADELGEVRPRPLVVAVGAGLAGLLGLAAIVGGVGALRTGPRPEVALEPAGADAAGAPTSVVDPPTSTPSTSAPPAPASTTTSTTTPPAGPAGCPAPDGPVADVDGDGCARAVTVEGTTVATEDGRFQVGEEGDLVVVGDWDCDGSATPVLVRPSSGDVFVFDRWATTEPLTVEATRSVGEVTEARAQRQQGCDRLLVTGDGGERPVDLELDR